MTNLTAEMLVIKGKMKEVWSAGDFGVIAKIIEEEGKDFIKRLNIKPGSTLLDVACGTGNLAIPAARAGAIVTGLDLVPNLIRQSTERASAEGLNAKFDVGDAEALPYGANEFDYVVTMFGAMFAPRPDVTTNELLRVCKPGGTIAMANWTPGGSIGELFKLAASYVPPPPGLAPPSLWGDESVVKERFGDRVSELRCNKRILIQNIPFPPAGAADHFITYFGPTKKLYETLEEDKRNRFRNDFTKFWAEHNISPDGVTIMESEYLEVVAVKS
jgi:SAM-dependent methyltransferase